MQGKITRDSIFLEASEEMLQDFERLRRTIPHNASKGAEVELVLRSFLEQRLPKRFGVGSGFILGARDEVSKQTDVVIYDAHNCPLLRTSNLSGIFPVENVACIVSVKSVISRSAIEDAWEQTDIVKAMSRLPGMQHVPINNDPGVTTLGGEKPSITMGVLFGFTSELDLNTIQQIYSERFISVGVGRHLDMIVALDKGGIVTTVANFPGDDGWAPITFDGDISRSDNLDGVNFGTGTLRTGPRTLEAFFRFLLHRLGTFAAVLPHPGFNLPEVEEIFVRYLDVFTSETDPVKREAIRLASWARVSSKFEESL